MTNLYPICPFPPTTRCPAYGTTFPFRSSHGDTREGILANQPDRRPQDPLRKLSEFLATRSELYESKPDSAAGGTKTAKTAGDDVDEDEDMEDE